MHVKQIVGQVVDTLGAPIPGAIVGSQWHIDQSRLMCSCATTTDADGLFSISLDQPTDHTAMPFLIGLFAVDPDQTRGGSVVVNSAAVDSPIQILLVPLVRIRGQVAAAQGDLPQRTMTMIEPVIDPNQQPMSWVPWHLSCGSETGAFIVLVPPGSYHLRSYGIEGNEIVTDQSIQTILVPATIPETDVGLVQVRPTRLANLYGQVAPEWKITAAHGIRPDIRLADFCGKWLLMEFWTKNCGPCIAHGLPELMAFYEHHWSQRNQFEILGLHIDDGSISDLGMELQQLSHRYWSGKSVRFPVLLVDDYTAQEVYGIRGLPTRLFVDPAGKITKGLTLKTFAALLQSQ
jgi:hypothetical protein